METDVLTPDIPCEIVPRCDATPEQLKALGEALAAWSEEQFATDSALRTIDNLVVAQFLGTDDLLEMVFAVVYAESADDGLTITRRGRGATQAAAPEPLIVFCSFRGANYDRGRVIAGLRAAIPAELVQDIVIDGRSWNEA